MSSSAGLNEIAPRRCSPTPGRLVKSGSRSTARLTLPDEPRNLKRRTSSSNSPSSVPGWARYRTPIRDLWMCGSATHPGGGIMGAPGRIAALEVLKARKGMLGRRGRAA